ncbi:hypothetical protein COEREDRAFT_12272 [Coemansia reversa NRRL 1564]|uniref:Uncharacterized protein n=1 Tax=Coemansia reversa (strain ATCC 12441 / NRRL 1564) TaxID=763665 RepID=A0A2G5B150_COERN|nr:hypothetical protein COEREDRAFT_12272 [Coemansia reversa NRRL 1564]|eukprot:PIA12745.1 hypothetical protein COEREDRAFT_12272 [Coemansia reversa NRRL 1564]
MAITFGNIFIVSAVAVFSSLALTANSMPAPHVHQRRGNDGVGAYGSAYPYGGAGLYDNAYSYGNAGPYSSLGAYNGFYPGDGAYPYGNFGYGYGIGFPYASSFTNTFDANSNFANYNDDTLYVNNKDATAASSNVNSYNNANVIG